MTAIIFDTLIFSHQLEKAGLSKEQAEMLAESQKEIIEQQTQRIQEGIHHIEGKLDKAIATHVATKEDFWNLKNEVKQDCSNLDKKIDLLRKEFEGKFNLLYWMTGFTLAICCSILFKIYFSS